MEYQKPRIEFYRQRTFSEKLNATFDFIRENWKPLLKYSFYLIMPICLVQTFAINSFLGNYISLLSSTNGRLFDYSLGNSLFNFLASYGIMMFCVFIGTAILSAMIFAMMQTYAVRENRLQDITLNDFKDKLIKNIWKYVVIFIILVIEYIFIAFFTVFIGAIVVLISSFLASLLIIAVMICVIPLMMIIPVYIFERDISIIDAVKKAWILGAKTIWSMIGLLIILYIIAGIIQTVTMMPWYLALVGGSIFSISTDAALTNSVTYKFALYLLGLIQAFGMYVSMIIGIIGLAFQYFHAREKVEGVTIESNISKFDEL